MLLYRFFYGTVFTDFAVINNNLKLCHVYRADDINPPAKRLRFIELQGKIPWIRWNKTYKQTTEQVLTKHYIILFKCEKYLLHKEQIPFLTYKVIYFQRVYNEKKINDLNWRKIMDFSTVRWDLYGRVQARINFQNIAWLSGQSSVWNKIFMNNTNKMRRIFRMQNGWIKLSPETGLRVKV